MNINHEIKSTKQHTVRTSTDSHHISVECFTLSNCHHWEIWEIDVSCSICHSPYSLSLSHSFSLFLLMSIPFSFHPTKEICEMVFCFCCALDFFVVVFLKEKKRRSYMQQYSLSFNIFLSICVFGRFFFCITDICASLVLDICYRGDFTSRILWRMLGHGLAIC